MKLRIKGNSVRFRLTKPEVEHFAEHGYVEEKTEFGFAVLYYAVQRMPDIQNLDAVFEDGKVLLFVPATMSTEWTTTDLVGLENLMEIGNGKQLHLLLEKDWACIDRTDEDQSDNYPNPNLAC